MGKLAASYFIAALSIVLAVSVYDLLTDLGAVPDRKLKGVAKKSKLRREKNRWRIEFYLFNVRTKAFDTFKRGFDLQDYKD
ncbi:MAG: hypothetical protein ACOCZ8_06665, partial [Bacteroidota bacterium]